LKAVQRGLTLAEVVVASVLLGVGVAGLISSATLAMRNQKRADERSVALCVAQEVLAQVEMIGAHTWLLGRPTKGTETREGADYQWELKIEQRPVGELFSVQVAVNWVSAGAGGSVALETWLNDYEAKALTPLEQRNRAGPAEANAPPARGQ